ncbi:hypothetical protein CO116_00240 [Candidatus Falkowbacteria bacterium CG_4_9_14_3_um_filter_38_19]|uniref:GGDEF domain-containing protein n=2 Tax=Candidatus Falkowiibacteriota TaxID=1752728 RepID=A0A2M6WQE9_9BACT|nr:GGDEF domain-containing protein [Candidatus Parcubacteria bacterium]PIT94993.1 MAG: hypothetical protein COT96_02205 [Candidatus Falkowbacteria bacterium CG10_big_fil_rev_8_21_14_0_10_38_22]PJB18103.1 MAG: hypothetical protein CO116_00240 [Candidatus Falkowbacteria bacterium CG_4_9_14_3_um_filter_38_19]
MIVYKNKKFKTAKKEESIMEISFVLLIIALIFMGLSIWLFIENRKLRPMAFLDALTGLPNRRLFDEYLTKELARTKRFKTKMAVAVLDLDKFKRVNDNYGHSAGDKVLIEVAARLKAVVRSYDIVARPNSAGDEFYVIMPDAKNDLVVSAMAERIVNTIKQPFNVGYGVEAEIGVSIGIALSPDHGADPEILIKQADSAMYEAKKNGYDDL